MRWLNPTLSLVILLTGAAWTASELRVVWYAGDHMLGFHPLVLLAFPVAGLLAAFGLVTARYRRSPLLAAATLIAAGLIVSPIFTGRYLLERAWRHSIRDNATANIAAIESAGLGEANDQAKPIPDEHHMTLVPGFRWYSDQHIAAPDGTFRGFSLAGVPHIYVNKIRHGYRGVAWSPDGLPTPQDDGLTYEPAGVPGWYIWTY